MSERDPDKPIRAHFFGDVAAALVLVVAGFLAGQVLDDLSARESVRFVLYALAAAALLRGFVMAAVADDPISAPRRQDS